MQNFIHPKLNSLGYDPRDSNNWLIIFKFAYASYSSFKPILNQMFRKLKLSQPIKVILCIFEIEDNDINCHVYIEFYRLIYKNYLFNKFNMKRQVDFMPVSTNSNKNDFPLYYETHVFPRPKGLKSYEVLEIFQAKINNQNFFSFYYRNF